MKTNQKYQINEAIADLYMYVANRLRDIAAELFPKHVKAADTKEGRHAR